MKNKILVVIVMLFLVQYIHSQSAVEYYNKGKEAFYSENYNEAIFNYQKALEINPNYVEPLLDLSKLYFEIENYDYSFSFISRALKLAPLNDNLVIFSANIDVKLNRYEIAEGKYKKILEKNPLNLDAYNGLANLYLLTNRKILAKNSIDQILKTDPANFNAIAMLAKYYEGTDNQKAEKYYLMNIEANSLNPDSHFMYSVFCFKKNDLKKAVELIKTAINIKNRLNYRRYYGKYLLYLNQGDESLSVFKDILKDDVSYINYFHLAYSYYLISDYKQAVTSLRKAVNLRDDDEASGFLLNQVLENKFPVDDQARIERSDYFYKKSLKSKQESSIDLYLFNLKEAIRLYPKNINARMELAGYYYSINLPERYIRELQVASKYTDDKNLKDRIDIEQNRISYKLGDDWDINQYTLAQDIYTIPVFIINEINNPHYNFERIYSRMISEMAYENLKYDLVIFDEKSYPVSEKLKIAKDKKSPFYVDLYAVEEVNSVDVSLRLINSNNNVLIKEYKTFQIGNDKSILSANSVLKKFASDIPFRCHIVKIKNDVAVINAGRRSGLKLKDNFIILANGEYPIEIDRARFIYSPENVKGSASIIRLDENIAEIKFKDNDIFKNINIDDIVIFK
jgi:tetratricopeptide (TPR) repeat protein